MVTPFGGGRQQLEQNPEMAGHGADAGKQGVGVKVPARYSSHPKVDYEIINWFSPVSPRRLYQAIVSAVLSRRLLAIKV